MWVPLILCRAFFKETVLMKGMQQHGRAYHVEVCPEALTFVHPNTRFVIQTHECNTGAWAVTDPNGRYNITCILFNLYGTEASENPTRANGK